MKKTITCLLAAVPVLLQAQFTNDYQPMGSPVVTNTVNLVTAVTNSAGATGFSRHINTVEETPGMMPTDVWLSQADNLGTLPFSRRIGAGGVREQAAAIERCPNGDYIVAATTYISGRRVWLFRYSPLVGLVWSYQYINPASDLVAYCIRRTNEAGADNYVVAAAATATPRLVVFKINGAGNLLWNIQFNQAAGGIYSDVPKSMVVTDSTVYIAGNRETNNGGLVSRDLFAIGIHRVTGAVLRPYTRLGDTTRTEADPFINTGNSATTGALVMTYAYTVNIAGTTTSRIAVMRLTSALSLVGSVYYYSEPGAARSYGHTIYANGTGFDIGGGTSINGVPNPLFLSINTAGTVLNYRRFWTNQQFTSTYMLRDTFLPSNRYLLHNHKRVSGVNSMSLFRNLTAVSPCSDPFGIQFFTAQVQRTQPAYNVTAGLTRTDYGAIDITLPGAYFRCEGGGGVFRKNETVAFAETGTAAFGAFKLYPGFVQGNTPLTIEITAPESGYATINIFNTAGRLVCTSRMPVTAGFNRLQSATGALISGVYFAEVINNERRWRTKIVKQ